MSAPAPAATISPAGASTVTLAIGYLPYVDRFYAPADARGAFVAVKDACARYGAHIVAIPRDNLLVLSHEDGNALYNPDSEWEAVTPLRKHDGAKTAILALGATAGIAQDAAEQLGGSADVYVVNGLPLPDGFLADIFEKYDGVVTAEDGIIGTRCTGVRGFAGLVLSAASDSGTRPSTSASSIRASPRPRATRGRTLQHYI